MTASDHISLAVMECRKLAMECKNDMLRARLLTWAEFYQIGLTRLEVIEMEASGKKVEFR